ncbi:MAG: carboxypeptidase regulatory-like domain-containing protein [Acidobacteriota bacterium]
MLALVAKGQPIPSSLSRHHPLLVTLAGPSPEVVADVPLQWRPDGVPNLPPPFGRVTTGKGGTVTLYPPQGAGVVVWVDDPRYEPGFVHVPAGSSVASLALVPCAKPFLRITDEAGRELADASLTAIRPDALASPISLFAAASGSPALHLRADGAGRVLLPEDHAALAGWITALGYAPLRLVSLRGISGHSCLLHRANRCTVSLLDGSTHRPLSTARWSVGWSPKGLPWVVLGENSSWSPPDGAVYLPHFPCALSFQAEGHASVVLRLDGPPQNGSLRVELPAGIEIQGVVQDPQRQPVAGATVLAGDPLDAGARSTETDAKGRFTLAGLPASGSSLRLTAEADGFLPTSTGPLPLRSQKGVVIQLRTGAVVTGSLVDADTLQPIPHGKVTLAPADNQPFQPEALQAVTGEEGSFRLQGLEPGPYTLNAYARGWTSASKDITAIAAAPTEVGTIALSSHPQVTGSLSRTDGNDLSSSAQVWLERKLSYHDVTSPGGLSRLEGHIGKDGRFVIRGVAEGRYLLRAVDGDLRATVGPFRVEGADQDLGEVSLRKGAALNGTLSGQEDFTGWRVELLAQAFDPSPPVETTGQDGGFDFGTVNPGDYRLEAFSPLSSQPTAMRALSLASGDKAHVVLPVDGVTVSILVEVQGQVAADASLLVRPPSSEAFDNGVVQISGPNGVMTLGLPTTSSSGQADATGIVTLNNAPTGAVQAYLSWNGMQYMAPFSIPAEPASLLTLNFQGITLQGTVSTADGRPLSGIQVTLAYEGLGASPGQSTLTGLAGTFQFSGLGAGSVLLSARSSSGATVSQEVPLAADSPPTPVHLILGGPSR